MRKQRYGPYQHKVHIPISLIYLRFIDDIFFIWTDSKTDIEKFLNELNTKHPSIKFEYEISKERIPFLDTKIYIKNDTLHTKVFRKKKQPNF